ncbi:GNAT family N-acetyltransferase [Flavivirga algicola]|uniref:GNAT family N-acetyltransferase n=1 Tax=Flavivirga algicola TaxID=2729136 RepID=A0ABX1RYM1_9FLAO|nr:GNAT family N-acetyltransferase [Flavivirga algicola]NMH88221.1 GNAT family N-acetyltransferase [Flavivirga algicola]
MDKANNITFLKAFTENSLPPICNKVIYQKNVYYNKNIDSELDLNKQVLIFKDVSDYVDIELFQQAKNIVINKTKTLKGHLVELAPFKDIQEYLQNNFTTKSRSNFRRYENRLKSCFKIKYVSYYGNITKEEYDRLFIVLKDLLIRRFAEKQEKNYELQHLKGYHDVVYDMILKKEACLFVIYDNEKPISIRVNMCKKKLAYYIISGYDVDYSKFHLGSIDMLKNIEWCIDNNFEIYDLLKGYDYYKSKWATKKHDYYIYIIYNSNSIKLTLISYYITIKETIKYKCYRFLKKHNLDTKYKDLKRYLFGITTFFKNKKATTILIDNNAKITDQIFEIDINLDNQYIFLRKPVYNFLFLANTSLDNVTIGKLSGTSNKFLLKAKNKSQLLTINH